MKLTVYINDFLLTLEFILAWIFLMIVLKQELLLRMIHDLHNLQEIDILYDLVYLQFNFLIVL